LLLDEACPSGYQSRESARLSEVAQNHVYVSNEGSEFRIELGSLRAKCIVHFPWRHANLILGLGGPRPAVANSSAGFSASLEGIAWHARQGDPVLAGYGQVTAQYSSYSSVDNGSLHVGRFPLRIWAGRAGWEVILLFAGQAKTSPLSKRFNQSVWFQRGVSGLSSAIAERQNSGEQQKRYRRPFGLVRSTGMVPYDANRPH